MHLGIMLQLKYERFILLVCLMSFFIEANSQDIFFEPDFDSRPDFSCACSHVRRCRSLMSRPDWRSILQSGIIRNCGYRRICCPRSIDVPRTTTRQPIRPPPTRPPPTRPPPTRPPFTWRQPITSRPIAPDVTRIPPTPIFLSPPGSRLPTSNPDWTSSNMRRCGRSMIQSARSLSSEVSNPFLTGLIMGGVNASRGEFPWMVAINIRESQSTYVPHCTGFLIDTTHVLTAAHCFDESRDPVMFIAKIGDILQSASTTYTISRIVVHEGYVTGQFYNDIAVMTLSSPVQERNFNPICLPTENIMRMNLTGTGMTVAGWGSERYRGELTDHLKKLEFLPIVGNQQCNRLLSRVLVTSFRDQFPVGINNDFLCAGFRQGLQDSCGGDSGGPLMLRLDDTYYVVGLVSFGVSCGRPGTPGGYTQISSFIDWILRNTRD